MTNITNKILVVGATGTVGTLVVEGLVAAGQHVKAATRNPTRDLGDGVEAVGYDFDDSATFAGALEGVDRIFYLSRPADPLAASVAKSLFDEAAASGVKQIVNMSAMGVDADDAIPLRQVEILLEKSGMDFTLLRPNWFMQNFSAGSLSGMIREQGGIFVPAGDAAVSFVDARDIAAVASRALTEQGHEGKVYTVTGGEAFNHEQVAKVLSKAADKTIIYSSITDEQLKSALGEQGWPDTATDFMVMLFVAMRAGYNAPVSSDVADVLGRQPNTLSAFADEFSASFQAS